jgi:hypothetical protein
LLGSAAGATIAWIHFIAFDLFVGRRIYVDSQERRISAWVTAPALFLTLMLGPAGFLFYLVIRPPSLASPAPTNELLHTSTRRIRKRRHSLT